MEKTMKPSKFKNIVVRLSADNILEFKVDTDIFDDPFMEAATRAIEKSKKSKHSIVRAITECWEKRSPKKVIMYNSYWILVNASLYSKAEMLREKFRMQTNCDLAKEPIRGELPE